MSYLDTQGLNTLWTKIKATFVGEAPKDSQSYVRNNGSWTTISVDSPIIVSSTEPAGDSSKLWIDTGNGGIAKYYNGSAWTTVKSVWG